MDQHHNEPRTTPAGEIIGVLVKFRRWWLAPTLVCTVLAIFFALFSPKSYSSRQTLVVRDDLVGTFFKPGRFDSQESQKSAQETILEIARRPQVVRAALTKLGPVSRIASTDWPSEQTIETIQGKIQLSAPNGAEFGRTEVVVLSVAANSRARSEQFIVFLLEEVEAGLRAFRGQQFASMETELARAAKVASESYERAASQLREFESKIGADLSSLISLNDSQAGTNNLQSELANLTVEQRKAVADVETAKKQIQMLQNLQAHPGDTLEVPRELIELQPTLASLAKGLNDAVLNYSKTLGKYHAPHPSVSEGRREVETIKARINDKLARMLTSLNTQLELRQGIHQRISSVIADKRQRLVELSKKRVDYETLRGEVRKKTELNGKAQANLSEIRSLGAAATEIDLITRVDVPQVDVYPTGPSNKIIVFGGMAAGLFMGLGLVMLVAPLKLGKLLDPTGLHVALHPQRSHVTPEPLDPVGASQMEQNPSVQATEERANAAVRPNRDVPGPTIEPASNTSSLLPLNPIEKFKIQAGMIAESPTASDVTEREDRISPRPADTPSTATKFTAIDVPAVNGGECPSADSPETNPQTNTTSNVPDGEEDERAKTAEEEVADTSESTVEDMSNNASTWESAFASLDEADFNPEEKIAQSIDESWKDSDFASLRLSETPEQSLAEKVLQIEQEEQLRRTPETTPESPNSITGEQAVGSNDSPKSEPIASTEVPLTTSNKNSPTTTGYESDPNLGTKPEKRPTATTVDLRMLKSQLSGKMPTTTPLLGDANDGTPDSMATDAEIAKLADSIRDFCPPAIEPDAGDSDDTN